MPDRDKTDLPDCIRAVLPLPQGGALIMSGFPGLIMAPDGSAAIDPGLQTETLFAMADMGADRLLVLVEDEELPEEALTSLAATAKAANVEMVRNPIIDFGAPDARFMRQWHAASGLRRARLAAGGTLAVCCQHGAGRSGLVAALVLIEGGIAPDEAIAAVRKGFGEAIESEAQERWLKALA